MSGTNSSYDPGAAPFATRDGWRTLHIHWMSEISALFLRSPRTL